jgi:hypothetical protein
MTIREPDQRYSGQKRPGQKKPDVEKVPFEEWQWFFDCTVDSAGPVEDDVVWIQLSCPESFDQLWFTALSENGDRALLTALSAMQNQWRCTVAVSTTEDGEIYRLQPVVDNTEPIGRNA